MLIVQGILDISNWRNLCIIWAILIVSLRFCVACALIVARYYNLETKNRLIVLEESKRENKDLLRFNFTQIDTQ
jgi:hypothetical protein